MLKTALNQTVVLNQTFTGSPTTLAYVPAADYSGPDSFQYTTTTVAILPEHRPTFSLVARPATVSITVVGTFGGMGGVTFYTLNNPAVIVAPGATLADPANFGGGSLSVHDSGAGTGNQLGVKSGINNIEVDGLGNVNWNFSLAGNDQGHAERHGKRQFVDHLCARQHFQRRGAGPDAQHHPDARRRRNGCRASDARHYVYVGSVGREQH